MKKLVLLVLLLSLSVSGANDNKIKKSSKKINKVELTNANTSDKETGILDFKVDTIFKNVTFNSVEAIDYINIYNEVNQQIFSANARIILGDTLNISFLEKGTYYIEIIFGEKKGAKQIII